MRLQAPHEGFESTACFDLWLATFYIIERLYHTLHLDTLETDRIEKPDRNVEIMACYDAEETGTSLAEAFGILEQRIHQIVRGKRKQSFLNLIAPEHRFLD